MNKSVTLTIAAAAIAIGATACGPQKYIGFEVWEGPDQTSQAKKKLHYGIGGYYDEAWALLEKNDVDGAIALIEATPEKDHFDWRYLSILYQVKHDWAKAEECIQEALKSNPSDPSLQEELVYIQDHRARYVHQ